MKRAVLFGLVGVGVYAANQWYRQRSGWPDGVPLGNLLRVTDPMLYVCAGLGALGGWASR